MLKNTIILLLVLSTASCAVVASEPSVREKNKAEVNKIHEANLKKYKGNPNMLVLPGLLADRKAKRIATQAEATGLRGGETAEFFLIAENSAHDYEALAVSFAKPSDVYNALIFIGMEPGRPIDYEKFRFWPKGERVLMTFAPVDSAASNEQIRAESLILDNRPGKPLAESGFVFTGSIMVDSDKQPATKVCAADIRDPDSIASNYNEPESILDVPWQAPQGEVYEHQVVNQKYPFAAGQLLQVVMEPEYKNEKKRVVDLFLGVYAKKKGSGEEKKQNVQHPKERFAGTDFSEVEFSLKDVKNRVLNEKTELNAVLRIFTSLIEQGYDPFVTLRFDDNLTLKAVRELCTVLASIETEKSIRVEPPFLHHLYYKAFLPDEEFRDRAKRISQPWELHLSVKDSKLTGRLTQIEQIWTDDKIWPDLKITEYDTPTSEALRKELDQHGPGLSVILVFTDPVVTHGQFMSFLEPVLLTHPIIHVFLEEYWKSGSLITIWYIAAMVVYPWLCFCPCALARQRSYKNSNHLAIRSHFFTPAPPGAQDTQGNKG